MRSQLAGACLAILVMACKTTAVSPAESGLAQPEPDRVRAIAYRGDGTLSAVVDAPGGCVLSEVASAPGSSASTKALPASIDCRVARLFAVGNSIVVSDGDSAVWLDDSTNVASALLAVVARDNFVERTNTTTSWRSGDKTIPLGRSLTAPQILADGSAVVAVDSSGSGSRLVSINRSGETQPLTPYFPRIDSFALDPKGKEIAFSAKRDTFDIGLVSTSGSDVNWVGPDASDEIEVTWAPRGNKITYVVKQFGGTTFRTVHIPTGYQVAADFSDMDARQVTWEPQAEWFAAIVSSPLATDHVQTIRYGGEDRRVLIAPATASRGTIEPLLLAGVPVVLVNPGSVRYGHRYPLVVYKSSAPLAWHPLSALHEEGAGIVVVPEKVTLTADFWQELTKLAWVDPKRTVVAFAGKNDRIPTGTPSVGIAAQANDASAALSALSFARKRIAESATD